MFVEGREGVTALQQPDQCAMNDSCSSRQGTGNQLLVVAQRKMRDIGETTISLRARYHKRSLLLHALLVRFYSTVAIPSCT